MFRLPIGVLGISHHTASVELREKLAFCAESISVALKEVRLEFGIPECAILSTCNRVELYTLLPKEDGFEGRLKEYLAQFHRLQGEQLSDRFYWYLPPDSIRHLFRVACGLDSMVLGESEILGQVKEAYHQAVSCGAVGTVFHRLFQTAIRTGKEVRAKTRIGQGAISVSSVAVQLARRIFQNLSLKTILTLGAGEMGQTTLRCLKAQGAGSILLANRSPEAALALASQVGGTWVALGQVEEALPEADIVICSTSSDRYLITKAQVRRAMTLRRQRPLFLIDISVPRNLDPQIGELENVYLYDIDDLQGIASSNLKMRLKEIDFCSEIIERRLADFLQRTYGQGSPG